MMLLLAISQYVSIIVTLVLQIHLLVALSAWLDPIGAIPLASLAKLDALNAHHHHAQKEIPRLREQLVLQIASPAQVMQLLQNSVPLQFGDTSNSQ